MNKISSVLAVSVVLLVSAPIMALAACGHAHGNSSSSLLLPQTYVQMKTQSCKGGGFIIVGSGENCPTLLCQQGSCTAVTN